MDYRVFFNNPKFIYKSSVDFAIMFGLYADYELVINQIDDMNLKVDDEVMTILNSIDSLLTDFVRNEIKYFSSLDCISGILYAYNADYPDIETIEDLFKLINNDSLESLFDYIGGLFLNRNYPDLNKGWDNVKHSLDEMVAYIENIDEIDSNKKNELLSLYHDAEETKMRIKYVLNQFYNKVFTKYEIRLKELSDQYTPSYQQLFEEDTNEFIEVNMLTYIANDTTLFKKYDFNCFMISYIMQIGSNLLFSMRGLSNRGLVTLGAINIKHYQDKNIYENFEKFLKAIADPKRFKIMTLIRQKKWYAQALAKELSLTPATVNHHLDILNMINLVVIESSDNKIYYTLNESVIQQYLQMLNDKLISKCEE